MLITKAKIVDIGETETKFNDAVSLEFTGNYVIISSGKADPKKQSVEVLPLNGIKRIIIETL